MSKPKVPEAKSPEEDVDDGVPFARFRVPSDLAPGIYRQSVGLIPVGEVFEWPDAATPRKSLEGSDFPELLNPKLIPLDQDSRDILVAMHEQRPAVLRVVKERQKAALAGTTDARKVIPEVEAVAQPKKKKHPALSMREAAEGGGAEIVKVGPDGKPLGPDGKPVREADRA